MTMTITTMTITGMTTHTGIQTTPVRRQGAKRTF